MAYQNARRLCIAKRITGVKKVMYTIFFTPIRPAIQVSIPKGKSMNTRFYRNKVLIVGQICEKIVHFMIKA